ncbi:hypothetical protein HanIR_Chr05g0222031 [Helianthus annuus]|nr:hypothetical protein HanIR_Chr05g0222031 [Helianthus annuus]
MCRNFGMLLILVVGDRPLFLDLIGLIFKVPSDQKLPSLYLLDRPDSQPQCPHARSIHVNLKYLEARQKLQHLTRAKDIAGDITRNLISNSPEDTGRQDRMAVNTNLQRSRADPRLKFNAQREVENDLTHENNGASYNNFDFGFDLSSERVA